MKQLMLDLPRHPRVFVSCQTEQHDQYGLASEQLLAPKHNHTLDRYFHTQISVFFSVTYRVPVGEYKGCM